MTTITRHEIALGIAREIVAEHARGRGPDAREYQQMADIDDLVGYWDAANTLRWPADVAAAAGVDPVRARARQ